MNSLAVQGFLPTLAVENTGFRCKLNPSYDEFRNESPDVDKSVESLCNGSPSSSCEGEGGEVHKEMDHSDAVLKFISQMLMEEEDLENKPCMLHDSLALQATEKSFNDVLNQTYSNLGEFGGHHSPDSSIFTDDSLDQGKTKNGGDGRFKKHRFREDGQEEERSNKQLAGSDNVECEPLEMYDRVLLCSNSERLMVEETKKNPVRKWSSSSTTRGRPRGGSKNQSTMMIKEVVDLRSLLMQCAQAVASFDTNTASTLLVRIRNHSSPQGDGTERLAHYFANALEARLAGTGTSLYAAFSSVRISAAQILKAYKLYITACPFKKMSNLLANKTINKYAANATALHIIDFGILYGYQWPCLIHSLSERPGGPPRLRITGIDFPQPGFRPTERVEATGRRLANYCERFGVPFKYKAIAQKWETIKVEDIRIEKDELVVVNSLYRLHNVPDETVTAENSPRDAVLKLIRQMNPAMFIDGVVNGTYNTPFFLTRFREAMFHFSSLFDMFEAATRGGGNGEEEGDRVLFEEQVYGKEAMNIIACEGTERVDRPETYKQWQVRYLRAGFRQVKLDEEIVQYVRKKVKREYHKDFSVDEDGKWMLQGWKGRVLHAISSWRPA